MHAVLSNVGMRPEVTEADDLVLGLLAGDHDALRACYSMHHQSVRAFARRLTGDADVAEDLVHETFLSLMSAIRNYRGDNTLRSFILGIAVQHARHHLRSSVRRRSMIDRAGEAPPPSSPTPETATSRKQLAAVLTRALDKLPEDQRIAFVLCEVEERTSREVAAIVGAKEETVRARLFHAKKKLRDILNEEGEGR